MKSIKNHFPIVRSDEDIFVDTNYKIIYESDAFLVVDKPAPLPVHKVGRFTEKNLLFILSKNLGFKKGELRAVNRLDSETSGLTLIAKDSETAGFLGSQFERREVEKEYQAIVLGKLAENKGTIFFPLRSDYKNHFCVRVHDPNGEFSETNYELIEEFKGYSLVKVMPLTGRTHQIRVHFAMLGNPIVGDKIYIDKKVFEEYIQKGWQEHMRATVHFNRLALHATKLTINHPATKERVTFYSEFPNVLNEFIKKYKSFK